MVITNLIATDEYFMLFIRKDYDILNIHKLKVAFLFTPLHTLYKYCHNNSIRLPYFVYIYFQL